MWRKCEYQLFERFVLPSDIPELLFTLKKKKKQLLSLS